MRTVLCTTLIAVALVLPSGVQAQSVPFNPSRLPEPRVELPAMPEDGSGVYRLSLEGVLGRTTLTVLVDLQDGKSRAAVALPLQNQRCGWWPRASNSLVYADGALMGSLVFDCMPVPAAANRKVFPSKPPSKEINTRYVPFVLEPCAKATITLDIACKGNFGRGTCSLVIEEGRVSEIHVPAGEKRRGTVHLVREPHREMPNDYQCELNLRQMLNNAGILRPDGRPLTPRDLYWCRIDVAGDTVRHVVTHFWCGTEPLVLSKQNLTAADGRIGGSMEVTYPGYADQPVTLEVTTDTRIGRMLCGTVTCVRGEFRETTPWVGVVQSLCNAKLPIKWPTDLTWEWKDDLAPDAAMFTQALAEAQTPVMPGQPGEAGFWTWRSIVRHGSGGRVSCIQPPSFGLQEVTGADKYRVDMTQEKGSTFKLSFELAKPWHSFTQAWERIPVHHKKYPFTVTGLDKDGKAIDAPMRLQIMGPDGQPAVKELPPGGIQIVKRPPFTGPLSRHERPWSESALLLGRALRNVIDKPEGRGVAIAVSVGNFGQKHSDHGFATQWAAALWGTLARRSLTTDPAERQWSEATAHLHLADLVAHLGGKPYAPYDYQHQTPLAHWAVEAMCDAWLQTGNPDFKEQAMLAVQGICDLQVPDGSFASDIGAGYKYGKTTRPREEWYGSCKKLKYYPTFATPELLYALGRVRRDMATEAFADAESKAYKWAMEHCVKGRFWPLHVCHSASQGYPNRVHASTAFFFCRYLLECAPEDRRDVKLAEEIARWAEDYRVDWRRGDGRHGSIYPKISSGDRYNNTPIVNNLLAAIVFEELAQVTGDTLWAAKGNALATAAAQAIGPDGLGVALHLSIDRVTVRGHGGFSLGWAAQLMREYDALIAARREP